MHLSRYIFILMILFCSFGACKKDSYKDTSFVSTASSASGVGVMFNITQDNTGLVTISPSGNGVSSYDVFFGDTSTTPATVAPGSSVKHNYPEGVYAVKLIAHDLKGGTASFTQSLTVAFIAPLNLNVSLSTSNLSVTVSATATYATYYNIYFGDSSGGAPLPASSVLAGQAITHTYTSSGTYVVKVVALSGGAENTQYLDTIHVANQINLPVTFEDPNTDYTLSDFGGNVSVVTIDPVNSSNHVAKSLKPAGAQTWAGTTMGTAAGFAKPVPLTASRTKMTVDVYSPAAGLPILLKLEDPNNGNNYTQVQVNSTVANQWETLTFDFSKTAPGTPVWNPSFTYQKASLFFDFNNSESGAGKTFYWDNVIIL
jgi:hypothetical protein